MSLICIATLCALVAMTSAASINKPHYNISDAPALFEKFIRDYHRVYKNAADKEIHYEAFVKSLIDINRNNIKDTAIFDINFLADYTEEELNMMHGFIDSHP